MKSSWFPILMIVALLGLLVLLATLQYQWLGQISDAEQIRLESRLQDDTKRFADDFNKEIQDVYFQFQFTEQDWNTFNQSYQKWFEQTPFKGLIKDFHYVEKNDKDELSVFKKELKTFERTVWNDELNVIKKSFEDSEKYEQFSHAGFALIIPVYKTRSDLKNNIGEQKKTIAITKENGKVLTENIIGPEISKDNTGKLIHQLKTPQKVGFLIIRLNESLIKDEILPALANKYFSEDNGGRYKLSIIDNNNNSPIFQNHSGTIKTPDAQAKLFDLQPNNVFMFRREADNDKSNKKIVFSNSVSSTSIKTSSKNLDKTETIDVDIIENGKPRIQVVEKTIKPMDGFWTLKVQHSDGSLETFITNTRRRNLAISFGILSLLAVSIILIFLSSQRAKILAQKQMDFVSSVSHEFRTPLAVIYSASENLSDGVIDEREKVSSYGNLIKREGKKLSGMVEQILEFAGANSGKRKYDFRNVDVKEIINEAIAECGTFIEKKDFVIEKDLSDELPTILADEKALTLAIQNLINNSLKYSNGSNWLKISASSSDGNLKIVVEDKGIGILNKDKKQIFEPFFRAENVVDEQISGNGLGLSLVKQIIVAHNGTIEVRSEVGAGSEFIIKLPLKI